MPSQKIDDLLSKSFSLWIISFLVALWLWAYVADRDAAIEKTRTIACAVEFINLAPQLEVKNPEREVWVDIHGAEEEVNKVNASNIICAIDTRGLIAGRYELSIVTTIPSGVRLRSVVPSKLIVELLRYVDRLMPVEVVLPKDLPEGSYLDLVEIIPQEITVKGVERDIARIGSAKISPTIEELKSGKELLLTPEIEKSGVFDEKVTFEPQQIRFKAVLATGNPKRRVSVNSRIIGAPAENYTVQSTIIEPSEVMVEGPKAALDKLNAVETETIDISGISESKSMVVSIRQPQDKNIKILGDKNVRVAITLQPLLATKEMGNIPIALEGAEQSVWTVSPSNVTLTIEGLPTKINSVTLLSPDITAFVNVENVFTKQATLPVRVRLNSGDFKIIKIEPATVSLTNNAE